MEEDEPRVMGRETVESEILALVEKHPEGIWIEEIARILAAAGVVKSRSTVSKYVGQLEAARKIRARREGTMKRIYPKAVTSAEKARMKF